MPDLSYEFYFQCESVENFSVQVQGSKNYTVSFGLTQQGYDYTCSCESFKFRKKYCKHIEQVKDQRCGWMQFVHGDQPVEKNSEHFCPKCGNKAVTRRVAV